MPKTVEVDAKSLIRWQTAWFSIPTELGDYALSVLNAQSGILARALICREVKYTGAYLD